MQPSPIPSSSCTDHALLEAVVRALSDHKGQDTVVLPVGSVSSVTEYMVISTGQSHRHLQTLASYVTESAKGLGVRPLGTEGLDVQAEWILVDLDSVIVHVMLEKARHYYHLEKLWGVDALHLRQQAAAVALGESYI